MKAVVSVLNAILAGVAGLAAVSAGFIVLGNCFSFENPGFWGHLALSALYFLLFSGLLLAVVGAVVGTLLTILGFIFKDWVGALVALAISGVSFLIWFYLLNCGM